MHYHVWRSSHFSCFDAFVRTLINLWKLKKRVSEGSRGVPSQKLLRGSSPFRSWKNCKFFKLNKVHTFCQHFTENHYSLKYWLFSCLFLPPFLFLLPLLGIIHFWPLKKWGCLRGRFLSEAEKMQFLNSICKIWCISFAYILLKLHCSFPMKYWLLFMSIPPTFPFFFYDIGYYHVYSSNFSV